MPTTPKTILGRRVRNVTRMLPQESRFVLDCKLCEYRDQSIAESTAQELQWLHNIRHFAYELRLAVHQGRRLCPCRHHRDMRGKCTYCKGNVAKQFKAYDTRIEGEGTCYSPVPSMAGE